MQNKNSENENMRMFVTKQKQKTQTKHEYDTKPQQNVEEMHKTATTSERWNQGNDLS